MNCERTKAIRKAAVAVTDLVEIPFIFLPSAEAERRPVLMGRDRPFRGEKNKILIIKTICYLTYQTPGRLSTIKDRIGRIDRPRRWLAGEGVLHFFLHSKYRYVSLSNLKLECTNSLFGKRISGFSRPLLDGNSIDQITHIPGSLREGAPDGWSRGVDGYGG